MLLVEGFLFDEVFDGGFLLAARGTAGDEAWVHEHGGEVVVAAEAVGDDEEDVEDEVVRVGVWCGLVSRAWGSRVVVLTRENVGYVSDTHPCKCAGEDSSKKRLPYIRDLVREVTKLPTYRFVHVLHIARCPLEQLL